MPTEDWGEVNGIPLQPPPFDIPEDEREIIVNKPGLTLWTRKPKGDKE